ncbi:hypothetical protein GCM10010302_02630 [Streptomyces polychromogenes]|uniref:4'-phosphopantetheinyl transferase domain-containing protein n=1 Tax=Streptomyces polychromogenes TaxID=67342 RepID=A0ABN0V049_9ACTN
MVTLGPARVAPGVWLVCSARRGAAPSRHPADLEAGAALSGRRAVEFLSGRGLLRSLVDAVAPEARDAAVLPGPKGRPVVAGFPRLGVSISHDGDLVAAAVAAGQVVGVDVQYPQERVDPGMLRRCLHEHADAVSHLAVRDQAEEMAWVWAVQESCVKAQGSGLSGRPWRIPVRPGSRGGKWHGYSWLSLRDLSTVPLACAFADASAADPVEGTP